MSLFDTIFTNSPQAALNPLFSSNSKFKAAKAAEGSATAEPVLVGTAKAARTIDKSTSKASKAKKRKTAETVEVPPVELPVKQNKDKRRADTVSSEVTHTKKKQRVVINDAASNSVDKVKPAKKQKQSVQSSAALASANGTAAPNRAAASEADLMAASDPQLVVDQKIQRLSPEEEAAKLRRTVFVGNLPSDVKRKMIQKEFERYGSIESVRRRSVPVKLDAKMSRKAAVITGNVSDKRGTSHAYVVFQDQTAAIAALASNMHMVDGRHIRVDRAGQSAHGSAGGNVMYERNRTVFLGNLPFDVEDEEIIVFFNDNCTKLGITDPVEAVRVVRDSASQLGKGFGFVQFSDQQAARAALGCDGQLLRKRPIRVTKAVKVPAHLKDLGRKEKLGRKLTSKDAADGRRSVTAASKESRPSNKAVAALQRKAEPAENWQGFKTKGSKKTVAGAVTKSTAAGQRPVEGRRKAPEKRPSVAMRKQRSLAK
ncbi:TPA: hypothetical protein ACH3X1_004451 [Trebouxia sp. C0004]